ncbi:hypothetical protein RJ639_022072 [Escallonia herrerae]|uniref:Uncharacterized protein n=1 Tax=Escallonia herrerae TaxID=1293975 RepID=A0AA88V813_9ASTE|nr:hypothetical protein RJ639_022072 [Escallonia herrerae]
MDTNGNEEDGDQSKEDDGVHQDGCTTGLHVAELHHPVPAGQLEEQPQRQHHEQHHRHQHRTPVRHQITRPLHLLALSYIIPQRERNTESRVITIFLVSAKRPTHSYGEMCVSVDGSDLLGQLQLTFFASIHGNQESYALTHGNTGIPAKRKKMMNVAKLMRVKRYVKVEKEQQEQYQDDRSTEGLNEFLKKKVQ